METSKKPDALDNLFRLTNLLVLPFWLLMLLAPRAKFTQRVMGSNLIFFLLGGIYSTLLARGLVKDPSGMREIMNPNLNGITKLLTGRDSAFLAWTHFLTSDLFVGRWIYLDSLQRGKTARLPVLLTFLAGPFGLVSYLAVRPRRKQRRGPIAVIPVKK